MAELGWITLVRRGATACALGLAIMTAFHAGAARAADDDDDSIWNIDRKIFRGIMNGLGFKSPNEAEIEYRERAPLVVPPNRGLPPPRVEAAKPDPAWPKDPDVTRRAQIAAKKKDKSSGDPQTWMDPVSPSKLGPSGGRVAGPGVDKSRGDRDEDGNPVQPHDLGYFGGLFSWGSLGFGRGKEEIGTFTREPPRASLTDPPAGYQTPSGAQPYGTTRRGEVYRPHDQQEDVQN